MRILIFGDSITQGFYDTRGGWTIRLWEHYIKQYHATHNPNPPTIFNLAISGDFTKRIIRRFEHETTVRRWPGEEFVFVFSVGTNDAAQAGQRLLSTPEAYRAALGQLINLARNHSTKIMFVGLPCCDERKTTPVSWADVTYTNQRLRLFEKELHAFCQSQKVPFVPLFEAFQGREAELLADGLHPNDKGHALITKLVRPELETLLVKG